MTPSQQPAYGALLCIVNVQGDVGTQPSDIQTWNGGRMSVAADTICWSEVPERRHVYAAYYTPTAAVLVAQTSARVRMLGEGQVRSNVRTKIGTHELY